MKRFAPLTAVAVGLLLMVGPRPANAGLKEGQTLFARGDYPGAMAELKEVAGKDRGSARELMVKGYLATGDLARAESTAAALAKDKTPATARLGKLARVAVLRATGKTNDANAILEELAKADPSDLRVRYLSGLVQRERGDMAAAATTFDLFFDDFNGGKIDQTNAEQLFYVAEAARYLGAFEDANATYREAVQIDKGFHEANIEWGYLFLAKYAKDYAEQNFDDVLKQNPNHPDAHNGMAQVKLEQSYDISAAMHHLDLAFAVNPRHLPSLLTRASIEIDQNRWDSAKATIASVLAINENHVEARALLATVHWLRDDLNAYEAERKRVFAINPVYAQFYRIIARSAEREHRYVAAIQLELDALKVDPKFYEAMQGVGSGYLRIGDEIKGLEWLKKSWEGDQYNVRTYNTLNLFEDVIPKEYVTKSSKTFRWRLHKEEQEMLGRFVEPVLEGAFENMVKRYGFKPKTPISMELFREPDHYSVRTVGLPNLGALGVCFGQVITAMSPTNGNINWGMVLWHELSHVFAIQLSDSRVPRWYTEGLSEYETLIARPEWRRENDSDVYAALVEGTLPSVAELNYGFMKPNMQEVVVAYYLSAVTIEYIATVYGFDKIVDGLKLFAKGDETPAVIEKITGKPVADFDAEFRAYLERRLAPYSGTFRLPAQAGTDLEALTKAAAAAPKKSAAQAALALGHFYDGNADGAKASAQKALKLDKDNKIGLFVRAEVLLRERDLDGAKRDYSRLIALGADSFDLRSRLALIARDAGDMDEVERQLCAAKKLDPERGFPYEELADLYFKAGRDAEGIAELEHYVMIEQMQYGPIQQLVEALVKRKSWDKVRIYGEMGLFINPTDANLFLQLGTAHVETANPKGALEYFDAALAATPLLRRPALAHIGRSRAYHALGDGKRAKASLKEALRIEPNNADALALKATIGLK